MKKTAYIILILSLLLQTSAYAAAEEETTGDLDVIESELERLRSNPTEPVLNETPVPVEKEKKEDARLQSLAHFEDVSVIQRRFMPKTQRFQAYAGLATITNDPWFTSLGVNFRLAYSFTEAWAIEANSYLLSSAESVNAKELNQENSVITSNFIQPKNYFGGAIVWTPIYGKVTQFNNKIIPFDMYFSAGGGSMKIDNGQGGSSFQVGTGQIFAITKSLGLRWDLTANVLSAKPNSEANTKTFTNILWTVGASFFFPEASYR